MAYPLFLARMLIRSGLASRWPGVRRLTDGGEAFLRYVSDRVLAAPVEHLREASELLAPFGPDVLDLSQDAPRLDLLPSATTKLPADRRGLPAPWGMPELRSAVSSRLLTDAELSFSPGDEVFITGGAAGAFNLALDALVNPGDPVVLLDPSSPLFSFASRQRRARVRWVPTWTEDGRTRFELHAFVKALSGAKMLVLTAPNNPTGGYLASDDLEVIAWWARRYDVLIFDDMSFAAYQYEGETRRIGTFADARQRTLTAGSVSKTYGLSAARVGWLAGYRHLIRPCAMTAMMQAQLVPTLCQQVALAALALPTETVRKTRDQIAARRRYVYERLQGTELPVAFPAGAFFYWLPVWQSGLTGTEFADELFRQHRVRVTPGELFGSSGRGYVRVSFAAEEGRLREGLGRLLSFLDSRMERRRAATRRLAA